MYLSFLSLIHRYSILPSRPLTSCLLFHSRPRLASLPLPSGASQPTITDLLKTSATLGYTFFPRMHRLSEKCLLLDMNPPRTMSKYFQRYIPAVHARSSRPFPLPSPLQRQGMTPASRCPFLLRRRTRQHFRFPTLRTIRCAMYSTRK